MDSSLLLQRYDEAARHIELADSLIITAGAGMGVDSGLPDFRGDAGLWQAYPALGRAHLPFHEVACPDTFQRDPTLAWGFYGHRLERYRGTRPHRGFAILKAIAARLQHGAFVFTSNVDGQFQRAGFDPERVYECHGSIHFTQCLAPCTSELRPADFDLAVDEAACRLVSPLPRCPRCGDLLRPNILMFGDWSWVDRHAREQQNRLDAWLDRVRRPVVVELGAGLHIPTVRHFSESLGAPLIRINPREPQLPGRGVSIANTALAALEGIEAELLSGLLGPETAD